MQETNKLYIKVILFLSVGDTMPWEWALPFLLQSTSIIMLYDL